MELPISGLRMIGMFVGVILVLTSFLYFRGPRWDRTTFLLATLVGLSIIVVVTFPGSVDWLAESFNIPKDNRGRLIGLIIISIIGLFVLYVSQISRINSLKITLDRTIRAASLKTSWMTDHELIDEAKGLDALVLIPAYNEERNLAKLLPQIPSKIAGFRIGVAVIDDGSLDNTIEVAREHRVIVISNLLNRGQGSASRTGYDLAKLLGVKACVTMDADMQHRPSEILVLLEPILKGDYDLVIGSRKLGSSSRGSFMRAVGIGFLSRLVSIMTGQHFTDVSSGYKAFRLTSLYSLNFQEDQFQAAEILITSVKHGLRVKEVPVTIDERLHGTTKKGNDLSYGLRFFWSLVKAWWSH